MLTSQPTTPLLLQLPEACVVTLMGASGAGKSSLARRIASSTGAGVISYDRCRAELTGNAHDQSATAAAVKLAHRRLDTRCGSDLTTIVDGTHTTPRERRNVLEISDRHHMRNILIALVPPLEVCLERQQTRAPRHPGELWGEQVPADVVTLQYRNVLVSLPDLHREGFDSVHLLHADHLRSGTATTAGGIR